MPDSHQKTALLIGATGLIGGQLLTKLLHSPYYSKVTVLTRRALEIRNTKLSEVIFDFDAPDASVVKADDIFCCLGSTIKKAGSREAFKKVDYEYPLRIAKLAKLNGATKYLIVTTMGADAKSSIFYNRVKGDIEQALRDLSFPCLHILQPSLLLGDRQETRTGEKTGELLMTVFKPLMIGPLKKYRAIASEKVANAMVALAKNPEEGIFVHNSEELQKFN
jgi:uncharacterized protein YbjT (DUF2867 family)